jgi:hypothetical protein
MKLVGKVPVEPLDDERLTNIERSLVVRVSEMSQQRTMRAPRRLLAVAGIAMAVVVAGFVGWKARDGAPVAAPPKAEQVAMKGGALDLGDAQITGNDFAVTRTERRVDVVMAPGKIDLHVEHDPGRLFVVKAGTVEIEDVGTRFSVDYDGTNVDVRVTEGEVKVKHAGKELSITAGNAWTLELGPITIARLEERATQVTTNSAQPPVPATANGPQDLPPVAVASAGSNAGSAQGSGARPKVMKSNARKALEEAAVDPPDEVDTDDPKAAIAKYLERVKTMPEGEDKARVLYSIAVMQHRSKQDSAAKYTISGALKRQGGPTYKAALWLNVRINCLAAFDDNCRIAAEKYVAKFDGMHAGVAVEILKEISRGQ